MKQDEPVQVAALRARFGRFVRVYPALEAAFENENAARVFEALLRFDANRLTRGAEWFSLTDPQGAEACGFNVKRYRDGRRHICGPNSHLLFDRDDHSQHRVGLYRADYNRINQWLTGRGFEHPPPVPDTQIQCSQNGQTSLPKTGKEVCQKWAKSFAKNGHANSELINSELINSLSLKKEEENARASANDGAADRIGELLDGWGVGNPKRVDLVRMYAPVPGAVMTLMNIKLELERTRPDHSSQRIIAAFISEADGQWRKVYQWPANQITR